jgi:hypothetical protein
MSYRVSPENQLNYGMGPSRPVEPQWTPRPLTEAENASASVGHKSDYQKARDAVFKSGKWRGIPLYDICRTRSGRDYIRYVLNMMNTNPNNTTLMLQNLRTFVRESGMEKVK